MPCNGFVGGRDGERDFCKHGIQGYDVDYGRSFLPETKRVQETLYFDLGVGRPYTDVIAMLVVDAGIFYAQLQVDAITFTADAE